MERRTFMAHGLAAAGMFGLAGCHHYHDGPPGHARGYGPPPHAPAHGYRRKHRHHGVDLVFDSGLGVYVVAGLGYYFWHDRYYRWHDGYWQFSTRPRGPWRRASDRSVPRGLYRKYKGRGKGKGWNKGKGKGWRG